MKPLEKCTIIGEVGYVDSWPRIMTKEEYADRRKHIRERAFREAMLDCLKCSKRKTPSYYAIEKRIGT